MKRKIGSIFFGIMFLAGALAILYPSVSNWLNQRNATRAVISYNEKVLEMPDENNIRMREEAVSHNNLIEQENSLSAAVSMEEANKETYENLLNPLENGMMGIIKIPKIKVVLPIYHTTEESVLQSGIGHYIGSSLPVGGPGTHCILSGHRGLPSAKLFTDIDQMCVGDQFYIDTLGEVMAYQVDEIKVVLPDELDSLNVMPDQDYVTLVTCTPYGVNTHRMLVRGTRVPYIPEKETIIEPVQSQREHRLFVISIFAGCCFVIAIVAGNIYGNKKQKK